MFSGRVDLKRMPVLLVFVSFFSYGQQSVEIAIKDYRFQPQEVSIKVGDTVKWINHERRTSHSVQFAAENGLESERIFPLESWLRRFDKPGRYTYQCGPHPEMTGVVIVEN